MTTRVKLLAPPATSAQREARFPREEDAIESLAPPAVSRLRERVGDAFGATSGPERRVRMTAEALGLSVSTAAALRALELGAWAGKPIAEVSQRHTGEFARWRRDASASAPGGESLRELVARVGGWLDTMAMQHNDLLVIADQTVIGAAVVHALGVPADVLWRFDVAPASLTVLHHRSDEWRVRAVGDTVAG
jgi:broad specificity phosphatase PhoE